MNRQARWFVACLAFCGGLGLVLSRAGAPGHRESWQPILPNEVYQELTRREASRLQKLLQGAPQPSDVNRAKVGAILIAALTMSAKKDCSAESLRGTRQTAFLLSAALNNKDGLAAARELTAHLLKAKPGAKAPVGDPSFRGMIEAPIVMIQFLPRREGGDGIHPDLQSDERLKGAKNGILEKIRYLSTAELGATVIEHEAKELELLGYRTAVIGSFTYYLVPAKMKPDKTPREWRDLAIQMRDHGLALAKGAQKRDAAAVLKASRKLRAACSRCHNAF